jgi:hypothetical protein
MQESLVAIPAFLAGAETYGWLVRNGLVWGALAIFFLLYRLRPRRLVRPVPQRYFMGLLAGGAAAVALDWIA